LTVFACDQGNKGYRSRRPAWLPRQARPAGGKATSSAVGPPRCPKGTVELFPLLTASRPAFSIITSY
jgi:hypothetical protein